MRVARKTEQDIVDDAAGGFLPGLAFSGSRSITIRIWGPNETE